MSWDLASISFSAVPFDDRRTWCDVTVTSFRGTGSEGTCPRITFGIGSLDGFGASFFLDGTDDLVKTLRLTADRLEEVLAAEKAALTEINGALPLPFEVEI